MKIKVTPVFIIRKRHLEYLGAKKVGLKKIKLTSHMEVKRDSDSKRQKNTNTNNIMAKEISIIKYLGGTKCMKTIKIL